MDTVTLLLVDDHPLFRQGLRNVLTEQPDIKVLGEAGNGPEALELARKFQPDVMLLDINLPGMNGLQVIRQIQTERLGVRVVMLTAYHDLEQELHAFRAGSSAYCPKDVTPTHLVQVVRWVKQGHYVVGDRVYDYRA